ncbi:TRAP transporter large permease subunit [uncultured Mailhella sp.]|uniref:TRAP transporter large permease subunit n=1 Tax=uncultured Mailhella sp. TaxID=1981031 RepID=UPI0025D6661D|nr:TRAP transporter large permease subunit [uncultured Mailhella sp.]
MGSVSFLIADALGVNYWTVCASAFLPVVVYYGILLFQIDSEAIRNGFHGLPQDKLPQVWSVLKRGWYYLVPLGILIFTLGVLKYSAQTSILYTIIALVVCSFFSERTRLTPGRIREILDDTAAGMIMVIPLCTGIGILVGALNISGLGNGLAGELADIAGNSRFLLLAMTAIAIFIMGMGMTALACYLLAVALLVPALIAAGVLPIAAHMFLFYYGTLSFITPPVAIAAFVAAAIADADATRTGLLATRLGISAFFLP